MCCTKKKGGWAGSQKKQKGGKEVKTRGLSTHVQAQGLAAAFPVVTEVAGSDARCLKRQAAREVDEAVCTDELVASDSKADD